MNLGVAAEPADIRGEDVPPVRDYLKAKQKNGSDLCAEEIFRETWLWLKARGCEMLVNNQLIAFYFLFLARSSRSIRSSCGLAPSYSTEQFSRTI